MPPTNLNSHIAKQNPQKVLILRIVQTTLGILAALLGIAVLIGWHTKNPIFIQLSPTLVPMQYNTALGFLFLGIGVFSCSRGFRRVMRIAGALAALLGIPTLFQYVFGINLGMDELLMDAHITVKSAHPGRMAPTTAICFAVAGVALFLLGSRRKFPKFEIAGNMGLLVTAISVVVLFGYMAGMPILHTWQKLTHMAPHTGIGFLLTGASLSSLLWLVKSNTSQILIWRRPLLVAVFGVTISFCMMVFISIQEVEYIKANTVARTEHLRYNMLKQMKTEVNALDRMASRWRESDTGFHTEWSSDAAEYVRDIDGLKAIELVDSDWVVRYVVPKATNEKAVGLDLKLEEKRFNALKSARFQRTSVISEPVKLVQGGDGVLIFSPIFREEEFHGFILGVFDIKELFESLLPSEFRENYSVLVKGSDGLIYSSNQDAITQYLTEEAYWIREEVTMSGLDLVLEVKPVQKKIKASQSSLKYLTFVVGCLLSCLFAWIVFISTKSRGRLERIDSVNKELNEEVRERTRIEAQLAGARDDAVQSAQMKSEFLANMSHEIRTPMNGVIGMLDLLKDTRLDATQTEFLNISQISAETLLRVIDDILDFSKIEAGHLELAAVNFDLNSLVEDTVGAFVDAAAAKNIEITELVHESVQSELIGDTQRLRQILNNLIGNAIKFTENGSIHIEVASEEQDADNIILKFDISDTGIGIPKDQQAKLFDSFTQADGSMTRKYGGTGLGLTISKQLVELMHGQIMLQSEPNEGTCFSFTVLLKKQRKQASLKLVSPDLSGLKVMAVDDIETNLKVISYQLASVSIESTTVSSGEEALKLLREANSKGEPFDLLILDLMMPDLDGMTLSKVISEDENIKTPKMILMPSFGTRDQFKEAKKTGMSACLLKPVRRESLIKCIKTVMRKENTQPKTTPKPIAPAAQPRELLLEPFAKEKEEWILVAEDNKVNQRVTRMQIESLGFAVEIAADGAEALERLNSDRQYVLVLMDCQMPNINGYEATREIRMREFGGERMPIVALTANALKGERDACLEAGMDDYLAKPLKKADLAKAIDKWRVKGEEVSEEVSTGPEPMGVLGSIEARMAEIEEEVGVVDFDDLLCEYVEDTKKGLAELELAIARKDVEVIIRTAHSIKGSSMAVGAIDVSETCAQIETLGELEEFIDLRVMVRRLKQQCDEVAVAVEKIIAKNFQLV